LSALPTTYVELQVKPVKFFVLKVGRDRRIAQQRTFIFLPSIFLSYIRVSQHSACPVLCSPLSRRSGSEAKSPARAKNGVPKPPNPAKNRHERVLLSNTVKKW